MGCNSNLSGALTSTLSLNRPLDGLFLDQILMLYYSLPPTNEVCEGYVFTGVCLSSGGPLGRHTPQADTPM